MKKKRTILIIKTGTNQGSRTLESDKKMVPVDMRSNSSALEVLQEEEESLGKTTAMTGTKTASSSTIENKNEDREEGEIVDEYEDIISSDEELKMRKRIEELEATNLELEKIENISGVYGYDGSFSNHHERYVNLPEYKADNLEYWGKINSGHSTGSVVLQLSTSGSLKHHKLIKSSTVSNVSAVKRLSPIPISVETTTYNRRDDNYYPYHHNSRIYKRRRSLSPQKIYRENDSTLQTCYHVGTNKNKKRKYKISKTRNKKKGRKLETIDISSSSDEEEVSILNRERLKRAINKDDLEIFTKIRDIVLQRNSMKNENIERNCVKNMINLTNHEDSSKNENTIINLSNVNNLENQEFSKGKQNLSSDDSVTLEEQELRMIALKSAIVKKHLARKKKKEMDARKPYSPSDQLILENFKSPLRNSIDSDCSMDISPISSPETTFRKNSMKRGKSNTNEQQNRKPYSPSDRLSLQNSKNTSPLDSIDSGPMDISPIESPEFLSDSYNKPIDMDIANSSESSTPTPLMNSSVVMRSDLGDRIDWLPIEQVPASNCDANSGIILSPKPIKYSLTSEGRNNHLRFNSFHDNEKDNERVRIITVSNSPEDSNDEEELALRALLLSKLNSPKVNSKRNVNVITKQENEYFQVGNPNNIQSDPLEGINSPILIKSTLNSDPEGSLDAEMLGNGFPSMKEKKSFSKTELVLKEAVRRLRNKSQMSVNSPSEATIRTPEIIYSSNEQFSERDTIINTVVDTIQNFSNYENRVKTNNEENISVGLKYTNASTSNSPCQQLLNQLPLRPSNMNVENYKRDQKMNAFLNNSNGMMSEGKLQTTGFPILSSPILIQNQIENTPIPEQAPNFFNNENQRNNLISIPLTVSTVNTSIGDAESQPSPKIKVTKSNNVPSLGKTISKKQLTSTNEKKVCKIAGKATKHKIIKKSIVSSQQHPVQNTQPKDSNFSSNHNNLSLNEYVSSKTDLHSTTPMLSSSSSLSIPPSITSVRNFIPTGMTKTITNNEMITTTSSGSIINIPIVKRMIINLKESDSDSDESFPTLTSSVGTFLSKDYEFNDNASPKSLQINSPCDSPSLLSATCLPSDTCQDQKSVKTESNQSINTLSSEKNTTIGSKSIVNDVFKARLDEYLKNVRSKVDSTKMNNTLTPANPTETSEETPVTSLAVCHLPPSSQLEYRKLINRMKILERQKQIRNSTESKVNKKIDVENLKVTIENENATNSKKTDRNIICQKKTATPMIVNLQKTIINEMAIEFLTRTPSDEISSNKDDVSILNKKHLLTNINCLQQSNEENTNENNTPLEDESRLKENLDRNENNSSEENQDMYKELENSYNLNSTKLLSNFSEAIDLIQKAKEKKLIKFELQLKQEKLKTEMKKIEKEIGSEEGAISKIISKISKMHKTIVGQKKRNIDLEKLMKQKNYKIPQDIAREEISKQNKEFSGLIQEYKNLKSSGFIKANEEKTFCISSCACVKLKIPNDEDKTMNVESKHKEIEKIPENTISDVLLADGTFHFAEKVEEKKTMEELNLSKNNNFIPNNIATIEDEEKMIVASSSNTLESTEDNTKKFKVCENIQNSVQKNEAESLGLDAQSLYEGIQEKIANEMKEGKGVNDESMEITSSGNNPPKQETKEVPIAEICSLTVKDDNAASTKACDFKLKEYISPLGQTIPNRSVKPFGIVCPYQLRGQCDDKDCKYEHLFNDE